MVLVVFYFHQKKFIVVVTNLWQYTLVLIEAFIDNTLKKKETTTKIKKLMKKLSTTISPMQALKKLALCAALVFVCVNINAQSTNFDKLAKMKGVEFQHVDKEMIGLAAKTGQALQLGEYVNVGGGDDDGKFLEQFDDVKVFSCEGESNIKKFQKATMKLLKGKEWETLVDTKGDDGEIVKIYLSKNGERSTNVILAVEDDEAHLVVINGTFDLMKLMGQGMNANTEAND